MSEWRPSLLIAWREVLRAKGRSALVLLMIALPVLAVSAATVVFATADVNPEEALDGRLGASSAVLEVVNSGPILQRPDPGYGDGLAFLEGESAQRSAGPDHVLGALGEGARLLPYALGHGRVTLADGAPSTGLLEIDLADDLVGGMVRLANGRVPAAADEVVANRALLDFGVAVGDSVEIDGRTLTVVGEAEHWKVRQEPMLIGRVGSVLPADDQPVASYLVGGRPVTWDEVLALNKIGVAVWSRDVILDPPPRAEVPYYAEGLGEHEGVGSDMYAVAGLIVAMALLEIVLLAGPAFAVGARRQARTLALLAASGGTPKQARRTVVSSGIVLGLLAALSGSLLGVAVGWALLPLAQRYSSSWFGPVDVPALWVLGVALFGFLAAVLAAIVPAWIASRQDVVAVLAGRRGDRAPTRRSPVLGAVLLGVGIAGSAVGSQSTSTTGAILIAGSAIVAVLGMILVVPLVVSLVARGARGLPLGLRYAARDAARHRTRTVPAVAAVAATVAGVVALGIANTSDTAQARETYTPTMREGTAALRSWDARPEDWIAMEKVARREIPEADVTLLAGYPESEQTSVAVEFKMPGYGQNEFLIGSYQGIGDATVIVASSIPDAAVGLDAADRQRAERALAAGGVVVFTDHEVADQPVRVVAQQFDAASGEMTKRWVASGIDATMIEVGTDASLGRGIVSPQVAETLGAPYVTVGIFVSGAEITTAQEKAVDAAIGTAGGDAFFYVERGYQGGDETVILLLVLGALGGVLMLGGTLTATFLALSDARPDLATLSAVGASPRTRRSVAASYALVVGGVGALLGALVGFIPGIAISYPLTSTEWMTERQNVASHYLDVPWLMILGLVVVLPLLTAAIVGLVARSRLPLVARLD